jgi:hypothetical protein
VLEVNGIRHAMPKLKAMPKIPYGLIIIAGQCRTIEMHEKTIF